MRPKQGQSDSGQEDDCMSWPAIEQLAADVRAGKLKATDLVEQSLQAIKDKAEYNSIIATLDNAARARAAQADKAPKRSLGFRCHFCKRQLWYLAQRLLFRQQHLKGFYGAVSVHGNRQVRGRGQFVWPANLDAFAHGSSTENSDFFPPLTRTTKLRFRAVHLAAPPPPSYVDLAPFALGSDTGGSSACRPVLWRRRV